MKNFLLILFAVLCFATNMFAQLDTATFEPFTYVERMPKFPEGQAEMYKYIYANIHYPAEAQLHKITGQVIVQFVVTAEGEITKTKVVRGIGYGCDEEAVRVVNSMNEGHKWIPGMHNGRPVPVTFTLPLKFSLAE